MSDINVLKCCRIYIGGSNHQMQLSAPCFDEVREKSDSVCYFVVIFFDKTSVTFLLAT